MSSAKIPPAPPQPLKAAPAQRAPRRWGRILTIIALVLAAGYATLATGLWAYYSLYRKIPGVGWGDVATLRFGRVEAAIGDHYYEQAREYWGHKDYARAIFTDRVAVAKSPANLAARLFLAAAWVEANRPEEGIRTLRDGIAFSGDDPRLQAALVQTCLATNHYKELIEALDNDFPARGVHLLESGNRDYQLAYIRAVLEAGTPAEAERAAEQFAGLDTDARSASLLAEIEWEIGKKQAAISRLRHALRQTPSDSTIQDTLIDLLLRNRQEGEARLATVIFLREYPGLLAAQLHFLDVFGSRQGADAGPWNEVCIRVLRQHEHNPDALAQLASLAAERGWTDLTYLLYENSLHENLTGFPFVVYYAASLVKAGDLAKADAIWRELAVRNSAGADSALYIGAMVDWGLGRQSEALQLVDRLRRETADDRRRRRLLQATFDSFGYAKLSALLGT